MASQFRPTIVWLVATAQTRRLIRRLMTAVGVTALCSLAILAAANLSAAYAAFIGTLALFGLLVSIILTGRWPDSKPPPGAMMVRTGSGEPEDMYLI